MRGFSPEDRALWRLALPMILSNVSVPLLGLVDTAVIGHLDSPVYLGGVAVGSMATTFLFMLLLFLRMSTTGLCAQAYGADDRPALARALVQPLLMALLVGVGIILLRGPLSALMLQIVAADAAIQAQAQLFMHIRWLSAPATLVNLVVLGWLLGVQYARTPVLLLITANAVNIALDLWLVVGLGWKVAGAAWASVIADYTTLLLGVGLLWHVMRLRGLRRAHFRHAWRGNLGRLLALNRDIMLRSLLLQLCFASLTVIGARMGAGVVAVNALLMNLLAFTSYALDGFAYAVEAHSGQAYGARDASALQRIWRAACRQAGAVALLFALAYGLFGRDIINLLTSLAQVRALALDYLPWQVILPLLGVWCYLLDGMFIGATRGADMRNSMAVAALGYGFTLLSVPWLGNHGLWLALAVFLALRGLSLWLTWRRCWRERRWFSSAAAA